VASDPKKIEREFTFKDVLIGAPLAAGLGMSAWRFAKEVPTAFSQTVRSGFGEDFLRQVAPYASSVAGTDAAINNLVRSASSVREPAEAVFAWKAAASAIPDPFGKAISPEGLTEPFASIGSVFREHLPRFSPSYRLKFMRLFQTNLKAIQKQKSVAGVDFDLAKLAPAEIAPVTPESYLRAPLRGPEDLPVHLKTYGQRIQNTLGDVGMEWVSRPEWQGAGLGAYRMRLGPGLSLNIPKSVGGQALLGQNLASQYAVGDFTVFDEATRKVTRMPYDEYTLYRFEKEILPRLRPGAENAFASTREAQAAIDALGRELREKGTFLGATPPMFQTRAAQGYGTLRSRVTHLVTSKGKTITASEALRIPELRALVGPELRAAGVSPSSMAKGTLSRYSAQNLFLGGAAAPESRRLEQAFREWEFFKGDLPAREAERFSWLLSPEYKRLYGERGALLHRTVFAKPEEMSRLAEKAPSLIMRAGEGEWEVSKALMDYMKSVRSSHMEVHRLTTEMAENFMEKGGVGYAKRAVSLPAGMVIGYGPSGEMVNLSRKSTLLGYGRVGENLKLYFTEMAPEEIHKQMFGAKGGVVPRRRGVFSIMSEVMRLPQGAEARMSVGMLKKNPHYHTMQMTSALWDILGAKQAAGLPVGGLEDFISRPAETVRFLERRATMGGKYSHRAFTKSLLGMAQAGGLSAEEFGRVFGGVPEVFGEGWEASLGGGLSGAERRAMEELSPVGTVFSTYAGMLEQRIPSGGGATIEPRLFTLLEAGQYGEFGSKISAEIARRAALDNPEALLVSEEVRRSLASFVGQAESSWAQDVFKLQSRFSREAFEGFLEKGGWLEMPGKTGNIYVPGMDKVRQMLPHELPGGEQAFTEFAKTYSRLARAASDVEAGRLPLEEFLGAEGVYEGAMRAIQREHAPFGKGLFGLARKGTQRVAGSRFLELASTIGASEAAENAFLKTATPFDVGLSDYWFEKMIQDSERQGVMEAAETAAVRARWESGEAVGGMFWRHPFTTEYSAMPLRFRRIAGAGKEALALMPEINVNIMGKTVSISALVAAMGDKDKDTAGFMILGGDLEKKARDFWFRKGNIETQRYLDQVVKTQLLKPQAASAVAEMEALTAKQLSEIAIEKLSMPSQYVGRTSLALTKMKRALTYMPEGYMREQAGLLTALMEQGPIAGKHIPAEELAGNIRAFEASFQGLESAILGGRGRDIEYYFKETLGATQESRMVRDILTQGVQLTEEKAKELSRLMGPGVEISPRLGGTQLQETADFMAEAMRRYAGTEEARMFDLLTGRGDVRAANDMRKYLQRSNIEAAKQGINKLRSGFGKVVSKIKLAAENIVGAEGGKLLKYAKPLAIGTGATMLLAAVLSRPSETLGPSGDRIPGDRSRSVPRRGRGSYRTPENLHPPSQVLGSPTAPTRLTVPSARITSEKGYNINARIAMEQENVDPVRLAQELERGAGNTDRVNVNISDNRATLNMDQLLNELYNG